MENVDSLLSIEKTAVGAHRELQKVYVDAALNETACHDWFPRFKRCDLNVEDCSREGGPKTFEDTELEAMLDEDPGQTHNGLVSMLQATLQAISKRFHALRMIQEQISRVPHDLKPRVLECGLFACEQLLQCARKEGFSSLHLHWLFQRIHYSN